MNSIGLIGYGQFGQFLVTLIERFRPDLEVRIYSPDQTVDHKRFHSLDVTAGADVVVVAVPIRAYASVLDEIKPCIGADTLVVDIATVKDYTAKLIHSTLPGQRFVSVHPMFGPASYQKCHREVSGFRIALTESNLSDDELSAAEHWATALGFRVIHMSAEKHDRILAETLFLTHYVGQVIAGADFQRSTIDTVSFTYLMDAVESVRNDSDLFADVSLYNPYCADVIERFDRAERDVRQRYLSQISQSRSSEKQ